MEKDSEKGEEESTQDEEEEVALDKVTKTLVDDFKGVKTREVGKVSGRVIKIFFKAIGGVFVMLVFSILAAVFSLGSMYISKYLEDWTHDFDEKKKWEFLRNFSYLCIIICVVRTCCELLIIVIAKSLTLRILKTWPQLIKNQQWL
jgi:tetrahydromethanopterin S-methyltransferase subunit G